MGDYKLKPDAPENAVESLSKSFIVPLLEKLLADGAIVEYEIDTEAIHTEGSGSILDRRHLAQRRRPGQIECSVAQWGQDEPLEQSGV